MSNIFNFNTAQATGIKTIDQVIMQTIWYNRKNGRYPKTMYLNTYHWSVFLSWLEYNKVDIEDIENFHFDGVYIKKNPLKTNKELEVIFYNQDSNIPTPDKIGDIPTIGIPEIKAKPKVDDLKDFDRIWDKTKKDKGL